MVDKVISGVSHTVNSIPGNNSLGAFEYICTFLFDAGFMMECSTWSGAESLNLQFMVPKVRIF